MHAEVARLLVAYRDTVQPKMDGLPMYNARLSVEDVGFEIRDGRLSGVLITPWCMNLVLLPDDDDEWHELPPGKTVVVEFPSGSHRCVLSAPEGLVPHLSLPLFTTVQDFDGQDSARQVAEETLRLLYLDTADVAQNTTGSGRTMSRRELLRF